MHLPTFPRAMPVTRRVQTDFRGYDHRPGCPEGGIYEMTNGSAADAPLFSTRPGRTLTYPTGGGSANGLFAVDGGLLWCTGQTLYFNGTPVNGCTLVNGPKVFAELGGTVLIWPDKVWYRPDMGTFGSAEPSWRHPFSRLRLEGIWKSSRLCSSFWMTRLGCVMMCATIRRS